MAANGVESGNAHARRRSRTRTRLLLLPPPEDVILETKEKFSHAKERRAIADRYSRVYFQICPRDTHRLSLNARKFTRTRNRSLRDCTLYWFYLYFLRTRSEMDGGKSEESRVQRVQAKQSATRQTQQVGDKERVTSFLFFRKIFSWYNGRATDFLPVCRYFYTQVLNKFNTN